MKTYDYSIAVAGVKVTIDNCNNITGYEIKAGSVSYNSNTKTLILDNTTIHGNIGEPLLRIEIYKDEYLNPAKL